MLFQQGKEYWTIARRYNLHKTTSNLIQPTAVRDMERLRQTTVNKAVLRRIDRFVSNHRVTSPNGDGPRLA